MNAPLLYNAFKFADRAHRDQLRKGTDTPYIAHPFAVGLILSQRGFPEPVVAAGFLHDTLEDSDIMVEDLTREFGAEIAAIVTACSEPDKSLPWHERKQHTIDALSTASWQVKAVAAADKLDNVRAMAADFAQVGDALWGRFKQGREQQEWYYRSTFGSLVGIPSGAPEAFKHLLGELDDTIERFFARTKCPAITLDRQSCEVAHTAKTRSYIVVDPETCAARLVEQTDDQASLVLQGNEDIFPLSMAFENDDSFLPGGDWTSVPVSGPREHDGDHRSYRIEWKW